MFSIFYVLDSIHFPEMRNFYEEKFYEEYDIDKDGRLDVVSVINC